MARFPPLARLKKPVERKEGPVRRVSLEIGVDLWKSAKMASFEAGESLRDLILAGLRRELERRKR